MPNQLANETSPYLLQHANNPVNWYPWGPDALTKAKEENKPVFLSIGYSACHWCHVMEQESFENEEIARVLNKHFVSVKVDREERPDLDQIYMNAVQMITGHGGWPMSVFLTPDLKPFFGGTYWPSTAKLGMPGFDQVLAAVIDAWQNRRPQLTEQASMLTDRLRIIGPVAGASSLFRGSAADRCRGPGTQLGQGSRRLRRSSKFPQPMCLQLGFRLWRRQRKPELLALLRLTLDKMARGGIYDHLAGGFARYSVDARWIVPHFEKDALR